MSTSLVLTCPVHGSGVGSYEVAGTKFCALCFRDFLVNTNLVSTLQMTEVETEPREAKSGVEVMCIRCGRYWPIADGLACPRCGKQVGNDDA